MPSITDLPDEVLDMIFKLMDFVTLLVSLEVCKKWNGLISENVKAMSKMKLVVQNSRVNCCHDDLRKAMLLFPGHKLFNRKYQAVRFDEGTEYGTFVDLKDLHKVLPHLKNIQLTGCHLRNKHMREFQGFLASLPKLEVLHLQSCYEEVFRKIVEQIEQVNMPNLKSVVINKAGIENLAIFQSTQLKSLEFCDKIDDETFKYLARQKNLEDLSLRNMVFVGVSLNEVKKVSFLLKRLVLKSIDGFLNEECALEFMGKFADSLEELEIGCHLADSIYDLLFSKFNNLKVLNLCVDEAPRNTSFYENLTAINSVKKLVLQCYSEVHDAAARGLIAKLPNVEVLVLTKYTFIPHGTFQFISRNLLNLHTLHLESLSIGLNNVSLLSVKNLFVDHLRYLSYLEWNRVSSAFSAIEKLCFVKVSKEQPLTKDEIDRPCYIRWPKLTHLSLGHGFLLNDDIFEAILENCLRIKLIKILTPISSFYRPEFSIITVGESPYDETFKLETKSVLEDIS